MAGYTVSGLTDYVKVNQDTLIKGVVLGTVKGDTIPNLRKQFGVKTKERLNLLNVEAHIADGSNCAFSAEGKTEFSEREIDTAQLKAQDQYCDKQLLGKYQEWAVKVNSLKDASDMPFEGEILDGVIGSINEQMEKLVWQGATSANSGTDLIDGFLTQALNADSASTIMVTAVTSADSIYAAVQKVIMALPEDLLDKATVFVSPANYRALVFALVEKNLYHYAPGADIEDRDIIFPGSEVKVHKTIGLKGSDYIYASAYDNMVYGCDLENDQEKVRFWYDDNSELFKYSIHWNAGVKTIFPDMVAVANLGA